MTLDELAKAFPDKMTRLREFVEGDDIKDIIGTEAVSHYTESFDNEGFTDESLKLWDDVKRRDQKSEWYGHSGQTGKFSDARTSAKILTGETSELRNSISYAHKQNGVRITNVTPYAAVHQFGLQAKIYGKKAFTMIARPFMGKSVKMVKNIKGKIYKEIIKIIK